MTKRYHVRPSGPLRGTVDVPGDKSIGHRALLCGALADGESRIQGLSAGLDNRATSEALRAMGVPLELASGSAYIVGVGLKGLRMPQGAIDCGNSGTTMRLLTGLLAGQSFGTRLVGDDSLSRRPMRRVIAPLRARGAHVGGTSARGPQRETEEKNEELYPPISIAPLMDDETLSGLEYEMPTPSAQVKSALLLSGLYADGVTALSEPVVSRDHTERMLTALGVPLNTVGSTCVLDPQDWAGRWRGFDWTVPGDFSSAAFMLAAAHAVAESDVTVSGVGTNPTRTGLLDVLQPMGAAVATVPKGQAAADEPVGDLRARAGPLRGGLVAGELLVRMIDEVPALCAVAAVARGRTEVRDARELRVKESDRIASVAALLRAFGASCEELDDGIAVDGGRPLRGAHVRSGGDHRIAMAGVILGLAAKGNTVVDDVACVETSFPGFAERLRGLGADIREEQDPS